MSWDGIRNWRPVTTVPLGIVLGLIAAGTVHGAGVTVITHGYQADGNLPQWPASLGVAVTDRALEGSVLIYDPASGEWALVSGSGAPDEEIVLVFDWSDDSAWLPGLNDRMGTAIGAADALYAALRDPRLPGALAGISLLEDDLGDPRRLHLIGHSRGAVVNTEVARRLSLAEVPIDQVTSLDPHPIDGPDPDLLDPTPLTYEGVTWADNYWRADGCDFDQGCLGFDFDGQPVFGAADVSLAFLDQQQGFDNRLDACTLEHTKVHVWYHGTVDLAATSDGECDIERADWYQNGGDGEGFFFAELGGGAASRMCGVDGGCADAGRVTPIPVPVPLNGDFSFGAGQSAGWLWHGGGGTAEILEDAGDPYLELGPGGDERIHNRFHLAESLTELRFEARIFGPDPALDDVLEVVLIDLEGSETLLGTVNLFPAATGWEEKVFTVPGSVPEGSYTLRFGISGGAVSATVGVDDVRFEESTAIPFVRGDCNDDASFNLADPVGLLGALFASGPLGACPDACDSNDDGGLNLADAVVLLNALFAMGDPPAPPFPDCGVDPTADALGCDAFLSCP